MNRVSLVTDSTAGLSSETAGMPGIVVAPASFVFADERLTDGTLANAEICARMETTGGAPRAFGVTEAVFREAFERALHIAPSVCCVVTPFGGSPTFTTASAAALEVLSVRRSAAIKVANAGIGAAGVGAMLISLHRLAQSGATLEEVLERLEELQPQCDSLAVPASNYWPEQSGSAASIRDRLGPLEGKCPVLRVGTRLTGVSVAASQEEALSLAVESAGKRSRSPKLNILVVHANAPGLARELINRLRQRWPVEQAMIGELSPTHIAELGPGAIAIGACPAAEAA